MDDRPDATVSESGGGDVPVLSGWRVSPSPARRRGDWVVLLGLPIGVVLGFGAAFLVESVWLGCVPGSGVGDRFGLYEIEAPFLSVACAVLFVSPVITMRRRSLVARTLLGLLLSLAAACVFVWMFATPDALGCGAENLPTWWPDWLPPCPHDRLLG
jgi:hypothetical protein